VSGANFTDISIHLVHRLISLNLAKSRQISPNLAKSRRISLNLVVSHNELIGDNVPPVVEEARDLRCKSI
jgi:hypothetical protein